MKKFETPIKCKTLIKASLEKTYTTLTTAAGWDAWFTKGAEFNLELKGKVNFAWKNWGADRVTVEARAEIDSFEINKFVKFNWNYGLVGGPTLVEIRLSTKENGTLVEVIEINFPDSKPGHEMLVECSTGWGEALTLLKVYLEHGITYN